MKIHYLKFSIWLCKIQDYNFRILSSRRTGPGTGWRLETDQSGAECLHFITAALCRFSQIRNTGGHKPRLPLLRHGDTCQPASIIINLAMFLVFSLQQWSVSRSRILQSEDWGWDGGSHPGKPGSVAVSRKLVTVNTFASITSYFLLQSFKCEKY